MTRTRHLITSALPYVNGVKHLGNLVGSMLPADVYARFLRQSGEEVLFICATDEHGTPAELGALDAGLPVDEFCRQQWQIQKDLGDRFGLSYDHFGRSSSNENKELTQHFAEKLEANNLIEERVMHQMYSNTDERYLPDRYVVGTCPHCGFTNARGDQCENCTRVLDPADLIEPRSAISGSTDVELRETKHLFLLQSKMVPEVRKWIEQKKDWPLLVTSIANKWLNDGLDDRSITRDLKWGVPVNKEGYENKVFYVWFDAPIEYIGATAEWAALDPDNRDWRGWWYDTNDVNYTQFMAKDNIPFHTISWPCTLIGSGEPWHLVDYIKGFNWLNYYGGKFSTSRHIGVFMNDALDILPADYWRYYLIANAPESDDTSFTWEQFATSINKDLADTYGNFVNRTLRFTKSKWGEEVPEYDGLTDAEAELFASLGEAITAVRDNFAGNNFRKAMTELRAAWALGNGYLDRTEPWITIKTDEAAAKRAMAIAINLVRVFTLMAAPVIPDTAEKVLAGIGMPDIATSGWPTSDAAVELTALPAGHAFTVPDVLFRKLTPEELTAWKTQFGGEETATA